MNSALRLLLAVLVMAPGLVLSPDGGAVRADDEVWNLVRTVITPAAGSMEWEGHRWSVGETVMDHWFTFPDPPVDNHQQFRFTKPDPVLEPGATVTLTVSGICDGTSTTVSFEEFRYEGDGIDLEGSTSLSLGSMYGTAGDGYARFVVPELFQGSFTVRAVMTSSFGADHDGAKVEWFYEAGPPVPTTIFSGYALAYDDHNKSFPIREAEVLVRLEDDAGVQLFIARTDSTGLYTSVVNMAIQGNVKYRVQLSLAEPSGVFNIYWPAELQPATYLTEEREIGQDRMENLVISNFLFEPPMAPGAPLRVLDDGSLMSVAQHTILEYRVAALSYTRIYAAMTYGRDRLGVTYDHQLPLVVAIGEGGEMVSHYSQTGRINITPQDVPYVLLNAADQPHYHEFGHYLSHDSTWFGDDVLPALPAGDTNHGSVKNGTSQDSVVEGAAEFLTVLFNGAAAREDGVVPYMIGDVPFNLQDNDYDRWDMTLGRNIPWEEWQFASLLWDIMDQDRTPEPGDDVAWGLSRVWDVLSTTDAATVHENYVAFKAAAGEPLSGAQDPPTDLDAVFVLHDFYAESNGIPGWQQGEAIGYSNAWNTSVNTSALRGPGLRAMPAEMFAPRVALELPPGFPVPAAAELVVYPAGGAAPWSVTVYAGPDGRFPLNVPATAARAELRWSVPGYRVEPASVSRAEFDAAVERQTPVLTVVPAVEAAATDPPVNVSVSRDGEASATISWAPVYPGEEVVVVRGSDHVPTSPDDGTIVYRGTDTRVTDTAVQTAVNAPYAVFTIGTDGSLSLPADLNATAVPAAIITQTPAQTSSSSTSLPTLPSRQSPVPFSTTQTPPRSSGTWYFIGAGVTFVALIVVLVRRRSDRK